jgi:Leucine-rich repeat (LRR) protein
MIELNFYGFNYYLRRYIVERSIKDTPQTIYSVEEQNESLIDDKTPNRISELSINE